MKRAGRVEWGKAARSTKKKSTPLEPGQVTINEFPSNSQPTYAIHSRKDYNTQKTPYLRSGMSDTSGERRWRSQAKLTLGHCYIPSRERRQTGKKADHIGGANRKAQLCGADQSSAPLLSLYKKSLREARRTKPLMSWRGLYLRKSAKLRFRMVLFSIERELLRKAFIPLCLKEVKNKKER